MRSLLALTLLIGCTATETETGPDASLPTEGPNLVINGDFEDLGSNNWVTDWENLGLNPNGKIVVVDQAHSGSHAIQWQMEDFAGDGREYWVTQHGLQVQSGHRYALTGWYFVDAAGEVALNTIVRGEPNDMPDLSTVPDAPIYPKVVGEWAPFRFEVTLPSEPVPQTWDLWLHSIKFNHKATKLTVDDVRLVELPRKRDILHPPTPPRAGAR